MGLRYVSYNSPAFHDAARQVASRVGTPLINFSESVSRSNAAFEMASPNIDYYLELGEKGLRLLPLNESLHGSIACDFGGTAATHRRKFGGGNGQDIARAIGISGKCKPHVLDLTAGLGRDAFVLATLGCRVTLVERNSIVQELLQDGLKRCLEGCDDLQLAHIVGRMQLLPIDAKSYLNGELRSQVDIIYLDPMYPESGKSAKVKKEMQAFKILVGEDLDADELLDLAIGAAIYRVVVKRPRKAKHLGNLAPDFSLSGKSTRYDIYAKCKLPVEL